MAFLATIQLTDSLNRIVTKEVECEATVLATAQTDIAALITDLEAVTDLGVVRVTYTEKDDSEASAAAAGSSVDVGATFRLRLSDGEVLAYKIPGFDQSKAIAGGSIPVDDADVVAYFDNFEAAGAFTVGRARTVDAVLSGSMDK